MNMQIILTILLSTFVLNFLYVIIGGLIFLRWYNWKRRNPLDIVVCELTKNGVIVRKEIGRKELSPKGWRVVTAKYMSSKKIKDNLGYNLTDDDMQQSAHGKKRKFLIVAVKDGLTAGLQNVAEEVTLSKEQKAILDELQESLKSPEAIKLSSIPKTLSLKPILAEQTRLAIDLARDVVDVEGNDEKKHARRMMAIAAGIFVFAILMSFALIVIMFMQGPDVAAQVAAQQVPTTVATIAPGLPLPG